MGLAEPRDSPLNRQLRPSDLRDSFMKWVASDFEFGRPSEDTWPLGTTHLTR